MALGMIIGLIFLFIIIGIVLYFVAVYNGLVQLKNNIQKSWANINVLLKQRADELPKLLETVKGYMKHEKETLENLTKARTEFLKAQTPQEKAKADNHMTAALKTIFAVAENYPKLRASENFSQLQERISGIENALADRREFYNDSVNNYNIRIQSIPDVFLARMLNYQQEVMFKVEEKDTKDVEIKF